MARITRIGDYIDHPGVVITGCARTLCEGPPVSRIGDLVLCFIHGVVPIVTGSPHALAEGNHISRIGSVTSCGGVLVTGGPHSEII